MLARPKKNYTERWTLEEEQTLVRTRISLDNHFQSKNSNPRQCWEKVITQGSINKNVKNVSQKWQNMLKKYKKMVQPQSGVSSEGGELLPTQWELFDELHDFLKNKHGINPAYLIDADINNYGAGPSSSMTSSSSSHNVCSYSPSSEMDISSDSDTQRKKSKKKDQLINLDEIRKSVRNIEKIVTFATKKLFPDSDFPDLE